MATAAVIGGSALVGAGAQIYSGNKAAKAQKKASKSAMANVQQATEQARGEINTLYPQAMLSSQQGYQGALDVFGGTVPAQQRAFQGGNVAAQEAILAGLPQMQNAILGGPIDLSGLQPYRQELNSPGLFQRRVQNEPVPQLNAPEPKPEVKPGWYSDTLLRRPDPIENLGSPRELGALNIDIQKWVNGGQQAHLDELAGKVRAPLEVLSRGSSAIRPDIPDIVTAAPVQRGGRVNPNMDYSYLKDMDLSTLLSGGGYV